MVDPKYSVGSVDGIVDGRLDGWNVGLITGCFVGIGDVGLSVGFDGICVGGNTGCDVGWYDGFNDGNADGWNDGIFVGDVG